MLQSFIKLLEYLESFVEWELIHLKHSIFLQCSFHDLTQCSLSSQWDGDGAWVCYTNARYNVHCGHIVEERPKSVPDMAGAKIWLVGIWGQNLGGWHMGPKSGWLAESSRAGTTVIITPLTLPHPLLPAVISRRSLTFPSFNIIVTIRAKSNWKEGVNTIIHCQLLIIQYQCLNLHCVCGYKRLNVHT